MYGKEFQAHAKHALAANPFEPMVMQRRERPFSAHDIALPASKVGYRPERSVSPYTYIPLL